MEIVVSYVRSQEPNLLQYFDDWLFQQLSQKTFLTDLRLAWQSIIKLGLIPNLDKSDLIPSQDFVYVGMRFLTRLGIVRVPEERINKLILMLFHTLQAKTMSARAFLSFLRSLNAAADLVPLGRLHMTPVQFHSQRQSGPFPDIADHLQNGG